MSSSSADASAAHTMAFDAIIFDMVSSLLVVTSHFHKNQDGLLINSESTWTEVKDALLAVRGKALTAEQRATATKQLGGARLKDAMALFKQMLALQNTVEVLCVDAIVRMSEAVSDTTKVHAQPGAKELVQWVAENRLPTAIASSSPLEIIDAVKAAHNWDQIFRVRASGDECEKAKPSPDVYLLAARRLGVDPKRCLALEDRLVRIVCLLSLFSGLLLISFILLVFVSFCAVRMVRVLRSPLA